MECSNSLVLACFKQIVANVLLQDGCKATCTCTCTCMWFWWRRPSNVLATATVRQSRLPTKPVIALSFGHTGFIWRVMYQEFSERRPSGCFIVRFDGLESDGVPRHNKPWAGELLRPVIKRSLAVYASRSTQPGEGGGPSPYKFCSSGSCRPLAKEVQCARLSWRRS